MRLRVILQPQQTTTIPLNYGYQLSSAVYGFLAQADSDYASFLHDTGYLIGGMALGESGDLRGTGIVPQSRPQAAAGMPRRFKLFTFSQLRAERSRVQGGHLHLQPGSVEWLITSPLEKFVREFATGLLSHGVLRIGSQELPIASAETLPAFDFQGTARFKCLSPIVAAVGEEVNGKRWARYLRPKDPAFSERVRQNLISKFGVLYGHPPRDDDLTLQFDNDYLARNKGTKLVTYRDIHIVGAWCPFTLSGSAELMRVGYECGLGEKNSGGFGMVEVVK